MRDAVAEHELRQTPVPWSSFEGVQWTVASTTEQHRNSMKAFVDTTDPKGIPEALARLKDCIFAELPKHQARLWPEAFIAAIPPGADLSLVVWKFLHEVVSATVDKHGTKEVKARCAAAIEVLRMMSEGKEVDAAARDAAAWSAYAAAHATAATALSDAWSTIGVLFLAAGAWANGSDALGAACALGALIFAQSAWSRTGSRSGIAAWFDVFLAAVAGVLAIAAWDPIYAGAIVPLVIAAWGRSALAITADAITAAAHAAPWSEMSKTLLRLLSEAKA